MNRLLIICLLLYHSNAFTQFKLNSCTAVLDTIEFYKDTSNISVIFGDDFEAGGGYSCARTMNGSIGTRLHEWNYTSKAIKFYHSHSTYFVFEDVPDSLKSKSSKPFLSIEFFKGADHNIFGIKPGISTFNNLLTFEGVWVEYSVEKDSSMFGFLTPCAMYKSSHFSQEFVEKHKLDTDKKKLMFRKLKDLKIESIKVGDFQSLYDRMIDV